MRPQVLAIARAVGFAFSVNVDDIQSRCRSRSIAFARMVTLYVARSELGLSYPELGREVGRDHTTAMHAVNHVAELMAKGDGAIIAAVQAGEKAAEQWTPNGITGGMDALRERRRFIAQRLRELVAEAQDIDALLAPLEKTNDGEESSGIISTPPVDRPFLARAGEL